MPIRESEKSRYPANWPEIRERIRARAGDKCEECGVPNHAVGYRDSAGNFYEEDGQSYIPDDIGKAITIVCTVAHLDHTPENCDDSNLRFWCQRCHNTYDAPHRAARIKRRRDELSGQMNLLEE